MASTCLQRSPLSTKITVGRGEKVSLTCNGSVVSLNPGAG